VAAEGQQGARCVAAAPDIFERASPAVVFIAATSINPYQYSDRVSRTVGSGFIVDPSGLILTNAHVVFGRTVIGVTLDNGSSLPAHLVGADPIFDIAVLRIPPPSDGKLPTLALGDSDTVRVGEDVLAIGNPLGLDQTLTRGIVSAINRLLPDVSLSLLEPLIQTDAPINLGNSGGPLLNLCGEVIGITSAVIPEAQNIGFAIPINLVKAVLPSLLAHGRLIRAWLGVHGQLVGQPLREVLRIPLADGLLVETVDPGSPAEQAGLRGGQLEIAIGGQSLLVGGDIITSINGTALDSPEALERVMRGLQVGGKAKLAVFRDGQVQDVEYTLPERPVLPGDVRSQRSYAPATRGRPGAGRRGR
jgi:S1-C subfamily serine protease